MRRPPLCVVKERSTAWWSIFLPISCITQGRLLRIGPYPFGKTTRGKHWSFVRTVKTITKTKELSGAPMPIEFVGSPNPTIGVEIEIQLIDPETRDLIPKSIEIGR